MGAAYRDQDLVFCTEWGTALGSGNVLRRFRQLLKRAGVTTHYVVHDLRHTAASVLVMRGTPLTEVAQILGHAGPHVTAAVYAHLVPRAGRTALEEAEDFYGGLERPRACPPGAAGLGRPGPGPYPRGGTLRTPGVHWRCARAPVGGPERRAGRLAGVRARRPPAGGRPCPSRVGPRRRASERRSAR